jgi:hypothetical protein
MSRRPGFLTTTASFCLCVAIFCTCGLAQAQNDVTAPDAPNNSKRMEELEKQVNELRNEIAALKRSSEPVAVPPVPVIHENLLASPPAAEPAKVSPATLATILGPTSLSGFVDVYYGQNFNNPASRNNGLRSFDVANNQFGLNLLELVVDKAPDSSNSRTGYHLAFGYGQAMNAIYGAGLTTSLSADQYVKEAYFSYLAPVGKGLQVDVGKFVTPHGAEVIETKDNWNYSRGLLFSYAIPYYHFGMRAKYAFNDKYSLTGFFVNGWNDVIENNSGKTYGMSFGWNPNKKFSLAQNYMAGPEQSNNNSSWRQLTDTVATINATSRLTLMANYDYGRGDRMPGVPVPVYWTGIAGYAKYALNSKYSVASRYEYYNDHYGFTTGTAGHIHEVTGTFEHPFATHILSRLEYRHDMANNPIFTKGSATPVDSQTTLTAGLIFVFDSREGK